MIDISHTLAPKADQLTADDLLPGPRTVTITRVSADPGSPEQPVSCYFEGDGGKPFKPCLTMRRVMVFAWGKDASLYPGRSLTLFRDGKVKFKGLELGGVRISHMSHIESDFMLAVTEKKGKKSPVQICRLEEPKPADKPATPVADPAIVGQAKTAAKGGTEAFRAWWKENAAHRPSLSPMLPELQGLCRQGDAELAERTRDPFAGDPLPDDRDADAERAAEVAKSDAPAAAMEDEDAARWG